MPVKWLNCSQLPFSALLLLETEQIDWMGDWLPMDDLIVSLSAHPEVAWYLAHKSPSKRSWIGSLPRPDLSSFAPEQIRRAELNVLNALNDWLTYVVDPQVYDSQPFLNWDERELTELVEFAGLRVLDIGAGTGKLTFIAAKFGAEAVWAVEPVGRLREFIREKARALNWSNVFAVDGLITRIPFPDGFADVVMGGHVFGDQPLEEITEMERATAKGGLVILCPGNNDVDNDEHRLLVERGYQWATFEEPEDGAKRKYFKRL